MADKFEVKNHSFVPEHSKLNQEEKTKVFEKYGVTVNQLPIILISDPAIAHLNVKAGDVIKISRDSPTAGQTEFFRGVVNE